MTTSIAVVGTGVIGRTLATRWAEAGHRVTFGTRHPDKPELRELADRIGAGITDVDAAVDHSDVVLLAVNGAAMAEVVPALGNRLDGKVVVDAANRVGVPLLNSIDLIAEHAPRAEVFRAFNSLGWENFADSRYGDVDGDMLYSGPDGPARELLEGLVGATGLRPVRVGGNDKAGVVDDFVRLWFTLAFEQGLGRNVGFKILTR